VTFYDVGMDDSDNELEQARERISTLLTAAGYNHDPSGAGRHLSFSGRYRDWQIFATANAAWLNVRTFVCSLPEEAGLRGDLLLWMGRANAAMALLKYSVTPNDYVFLEAELRMEKLETDDVANIVGYLHSTAEKDYLEVLRVARGDARLAALSEAFEREAAPGEGSVNS
jgi:hypothetical protein